MFAHLAVSHRVALSIIYLLGMALWMRAASAEVYRWVDAEGNVIFSDSPREGAEKIELKPTTIVPGKRPAVVEDIGDPVAEVAKAALPYVSVTVVAPPTDATLRDQQNVAVDIVTEPELQTAFGHKLQLYVDGSAFGTPGGAGHFSLPTVERGTHQLAAAVLDAKGNELLRSPTSVFHLHKTSVVNRKNGKPTKPKPP